MSSARSSVFRRWTALFAAGALMRNEHGRSWSCGVGEGGGRIRPERADSGRAAHERWFLCGLFSHVADMGSAAKYYGLGYAAGLDAVFYGYWCNTAYQGAYRTQENQVVMSAPAANGNGLAQGVYETAGSAYYNPTGDGVFAAAPIGSGGVLPFCEEQAGMDGGEYDSYPVCGELSNAANSSCHIVTYWENYQACEVDGAYEVGLEEMGERLRGLTGRDRFPFPEPHLSFPKAQL